MLWDILNDHDASPAEGRRMLNLYDQIQEAVATIKTKWNGTPKAGIILGTGLGGLVEEGAQRDEEQQEDAEDHRRPHHQQDLRRGLGALELAAVGDPVAGGQPQLGVQRGAHVVHHGL